MIFSAFNTICSGDYKLEIFPACVRGKYVLADFKCKSGYKNWSRLFYVKKGRLIFYVSNKEQITACENDIAYIPDDTEYVSHWSDAEEADYVGIEFKLTDLHGNPLLLSDELCIFANDNGGFYYDKFIQLFKLTDKCEAGYKLKFISVFADVLYYRIKEYVNTQGEGNKGIFLGKEYIDKYYLSDISIDEIAKMCGMCESVFRRKFNLYFNMSPLKYKNQLKMKKAIELMREGNNISETAELLNFCDIYYFSRLFKQYYGVSPKKYILNNLSGGA